jgi:peptidyl-prolyl cis-trans isomerase B (cyclophilin B)
MKTPTVSFLFSSLAVIMALTCSPIRSFAQDAKAETEKQEIKNETATKTDAVKDEAKKEKESNKSKSKTKKTDADTTKAGGKMTTVVIETSLGNIEVELNADKAPISVENFLKYVNKKHYDGTIFHRVIKGFMIQGGGMDEKLKERKTDAPIKNEAANGLRNDRGTIAMARTSVVDSATSQFFINVVDNDFLNYRSPTPQGFGYAVFGKVTSGMDVVDKIREVPTGNSGGMSDVPTTPVVIKSIHIKK